MSNTIKTESQATTPTPNRPARKLKTRNLTPAKLAANRRNAQKSTGPRTPQGKAIASRNATKHGILAEHVVLDEEDASSLNAIRVQLRAQYDPRTVLEDLLLERMAATYWRLRRAYQQEINYIERLRDEDQAPLEVMGRQMAGIPQPDPFRRQMPVGNGLDNILRYEGMLDRTLNRLVLQFIRLRRAADHLQPIEPDPEPAQDAQHHPRQRRNP